uniref:NADH-ubiquinone oxidoreductase chain 4 n=1 Tax=Oreohelix idahoensis TaxID=2584915 RepID=A0A4Y5P346_9EUPU|nr:NADH dehydrogenase subunit 4 [Oreohelix idahoensis]QCW57655.1 NADH dehydrogenase subunit 4 [Oreohelix idahoensis]UKG20817.1 NADH dehydrogenase subunit 4 [Oreohelix idahoensis]
MMTMLYTFLFVILLGRYWLSFFLLFLLLILLSVLNLNIMFCYSEINYYFYSSSIVNLLIFLSLFMGLVALLSSYNLQQKNFLLYIATLILLLILSFSSSSLLIFYFFFEASLIPILILIIGWGYQPERLLAGMYMIMYTAAASLPLLLLLIYYMHVNGSIHYYMLRMLYTPINQFMFFILIIAFLVKLPLYGVHLWLPKAHVEAPLSGSMILAGILLKLGGYGLWMMSSTFNYNINSMIMIILITFTIMGAMLAALQCLRQNDIKAMVAYSSITHMSIVIVAMLINSSAGMISAKMMMLAHGWASSALFLLAFMTYKHVMSRSFSYSCGMLVYLPIIGLFWFFFTSVNMGVPPTLNFICEVMFFISLWLTKSYLLFVLMAVVLFFSVAYNMYLYTSINHGCPSSYVQPNINLHSNDLLALSLHAFPLFLLFHSMIFME